MGKIKEPTGKTLETAYQEFVFNKCLHNSAAAESAIKKLMQYLFEIEDVEKRKSTMQFIRMKDLVQCCRHLIDELGTNPKTEFQILSGEGEKHG